MTLSLPMPDSQRGAEFSLDRQYRYRLWHCWERGRILLWLMLNPSTANETDLDPTLRRCEGFARTLGFGSIVVVNLFAVVSADPKVLLTHPDAVGDGRLRVTTEHRSVTNTGVIRDEVRNANMLICGWGAFPEARDRARFVASMLRDNRVQMYCLGTTKDGHPRHPLYLRADTKPIPYEVKP